MAHPKQVGHGRPPAVHPVVAEADVVVRVGPRVVGSEHLPPTGCALLGRLHLARAGDARDPREAPLVQGRRPCTSAVFVANNLMSVGALQHLLEISKPPPNIGLASLGELPFTTWEPTAVSIVPWPARQLGVRAADLLLARIGGDQSPARTVVLAP